MPEDSPKHDGRTVVDRFIDRIKNNRLAAALIIAALGIGALASLADSSRKLLDLLPAMGGVQAAGEWKSELAEFYPERGPEYMRLTLREAAAGQILGTVQFGGSADSEPRELEIVEAKLAGSKLMLAFESGTRMAAGGQAVPLRHTIMGELRGKELNAVFQRDGHGGVPFTASRIARSGQLLDGRLGFIYKGKEYADHAAACAQMLSEMTPPQVYKHSDPPDEYGNVHCVGVQVDGSAGLDMFQNEVRQSLICPPRSRIAIRRKAQVDPVLGCECDGHLSVSGGQCL
jgi:hypothetical protein